MGKKNYQNPQTHNKSQISAAISPTGPVKNEQRTVTRTFAERHEVKTILDPDVLERYSKLMPDAPERVLKQFELNSESDRQLKSQVVSGTAKEAQRRDWMAFSILALGIAVSAIFAALGKTWLSGGTLIALFGLVVKGYLDARKPAPDRQKDPSK